MIQNPLFNPHRNQELIFIAYSTLEPIPFITSREKVSTQKALNSPSHNANKNTPTVMTLFFIPDYFLAHYPQMPANIPI